MIKECFIIGNGPSRQQYSLDSITIPTFGCNQIYREYRVDYLIAQDPAVLKQMSDECIDQPVWMPEMKYRAQEGQYSIPDLRCLRSPNNTTKSFLAGEWCIIMAAEMGFNLLRCIGFDGGPDSLYRSHTSTNRSLEVCQPSIERYNQTFGYFLQQYPSIQIITDTFFLSAYKNK